MIRKSNVKTGRLKTLAELYHAASMNPHAYEGVLFEPEVESALRELVERREYEAYGECFNCAKRKECERFIESRAHGFILSYCANKEASRG